MVLHRMIRMLTRRSKVNAVGETAQLRAKVLEAAKHATRHEQIQGIAIMGFAAAVLTEQSTGTFAGWLSPDQGVREIENPGDPREIFVNDRANIVYMMSDRVCQIIFEGTNVTGAASQLRTILQRSGYQLPEFERVDKGLTLRFANAERKPLLLSIQSSLVPGSQIPAVAVNLFKQ